jgi:hypothetical protein
MSNELIYSDVLISNSITNALVESNNALDNNAPFSFFDFLKYTSATYTPAEYNKLYTNYLTQWSISKTGSVPTLTYISDQYIDLLKDISLNFTTEAEKRFLSNIDFASQNDIEIAIPFFTKKIKDIILFYKQKRDTGTFVIERNKIKGTQTSIERAIYESIVSYAFSDDSINNYSLINYNIDQIKRNLEISIDEFVDVYSNYFDIPRVPVDERLIREELYTFNTNSIDADLFFDKSNEVTRQIFGNSVRLFEIPLEVNIQLDYSPVCSPLNPFENLIVADNGDLLGANERVDLRQRLYAKYLGTDFYYLSTNSLTQTASGRFIEADNPSGNLLNLQTADIAGVESNELANLRDIGLFFKPDKQGILKAIAKSYTYRINTDALEPNKIYIFPDPRICGNVSLNKQTDYPLIYTFDIGPQVRNESSGLTYGNPRIDSDDQPFLPYYSRQQDKDKFSKGDLYVDMSDLFNRGIIRKWQTDIYGNQYAIFKDSFGQYFTDEISLDQQVVKCLTLDGHVFFDLEEGYNFDYSRYEVVDDSTIRSGLTSRTVISTVSSAFGLSGQPYYLNFRQFYPYQDCGGNDGSTANITCAPLFECGTFTQSDGTLLPDPSNGDLSTYPVDGFYYYDTYLAGGLGSMVPERAVIDVPGLSANMLFSVNGALSTLDAQSYTCGLFTTQIDICDSDDTPLFIDSVDPGSVSVLNTTLSGTNKFQAVSKYATLTGAAFVREPGSSVSLPLSTALSATISKYNSFVQSQLNDHLTDFDIIYDSIFFKTNDVLVIDKIKYDTSGYITPTTQNTFYVTNSANYFNKISNRFFRESDNTVTFVIMSEFPVLSSSINKIIYPNIYRYDINTNKTIKLWPKNTYSDVQTVSSMYSLPSINTGIGSISANIISISDPHIVYNSKNGVWKLTFIGRDLNSFPHIFDYMLKERNTFIETVDSRVYTLQNKESVTTNWVAPSAQFITFGLFYQVSLSTNGIMPS